MRRIVVFIGSFCTLVACGGPAPEAPSASALTPVETAVGASRVGGVDGDAPATPPAASAGQAHARVTDPGVAQGRPVPPPTISVDRLADLEPFPYFGHGELASASGNFHRGANEAAAKRFSAFAATASPDDPRTRPAGLMSLLARHDAGDCEQTATELETFAASWPLMATYARFFAASCHHTSGRSEKAANILAAHASSWGVLRGKVALLALDTAAARKTSAAPLMKKLQVMRRPVRRVAVYTRLLASAEKAKDANRAREIQMLLAEHFTETRTGRKALKALGPPQKLAPSENLRLGRVLFKHHFHRDAASQLKQAAKRHPRFSAPRCEALMLLGRTYDKMKRRKKAWRYHSRALGCSGDALYWSTFAGGKNRFRADDHDEARRLLQQHIDTFGDRSTADDAALMIALSHREQGEQGRAEATLRGMLQRWPKGDKADEAAWQLLWPHIQSSRWKRAEKVAASLVTSMARETHFRAEGRVRYWYGRILQKNGKRARAESVFGDVMREHPFSWYAVLAYSRLHESSAARAADYLKAAASPVAGGKPPDRLRWEPKWLVSRPGLHRAVEFLRMGLKRTARRELAALGLEGDPGMSWPRSWVLSKAGSYAPSTAIARRGEPELGAWWPAVDSPITELWKLAHPQPFARSVRKWAQRRKIDPYWIWSIMREESNFNPGAVSWANAYGAMQIILPTAENLARKEGITVNRDALFRPEVSIRLASRYLAGLLKKFGRITLASPGYNAGGGAVARWRRSSMGLMDLDAFVESIPYDEARGYVIRVTRSLARYHWLYEGKALVLDLSPPRSG